MNSAARVRDTERFYALLAELEERLGGRRRLRDCSGRSMCPSLGVYFFFEDGEQQSDGIGPRVVRVGTHALTATSRTTLWNRLAQHRGCAGGGNHRGSIFRHHVGTALLATGNWPPDVREAWLKHNVDTAARELERPLERAVSEVIGAMHVLWIPVPTRADGTSDRGLIESGAIALLSYRTGGRDQPSASWLGRHAASREVRESGLWNVRHVDAPPDSNIIATMASYVGSVIQS